MRENVSSRSLNSVMKRYSHLISSLEKLEVEVNSLDNNGQFSHPSTRIRDDSSRASESPSIIACLLKRSKRRHASKEQRRPHPGPETENNAILPKEKSTF